MKFSLAWGFPTHHPQWLAIVPLRPSPLQPIHIYIIVIETSISFHHHRTYSFLPTTSLIFILWPCITLMSPLPTFFPSRHRFLLTYLSFLCHWQQQLPPLVHTKNVATMTAPIHLHIVLPPAIDINIHTLPLLPPLTIPLIPP